MKKDLQLIIAFLMIIAAFVLIMTGIRLSEMLISRMALVLLFGALLYTPLKNRILKNGGAANQNKRKRDLTGSRSVGGEEEEDGT